MHFGFIIGMFVFGVLGFYMLRISLLNTFGKEIITFENTNITYIADYGWFKDGKKQKEYEKPLKYTIRQIGYKEDNEGGLVIELEEPILCVTKMPNAELGELIDILNDLYITQ